jgi:hypothetical protein
LEDSDFDFSPEDLVFCEDSDFRASLPEDFCLEGAACLFTLCVLCWPDFLTPLDSLLR